MPEQERGEFFPPGPFTVSCLGFGGPEKNHVWQIRELSHDKKGREKVEELTGWMTREEIEGVIEEKFPKARESGSHVFCPPCSERYRKSIGEEINKMKGKNGREKSKDNH